MLPEALHHRIVSCVGSDLISWVLVQAEEAAARKAEREAGQAAERAQRDGAAGPPGDAPQGPPQRGWSRRGSRSGPDSLHAARSSSGDGAGPPPGDLACSHANYEASSGRASSPVIKCCDLPVIHLPNGFHRAHPQACCADQTHVGTHACP